MKKSKIFMGTAILLLAVMGSYAAKKAVITGDIYSFNGTNYVFDGDIQVPCAIGGIGCLDENGFQEYLYTTAHGYQSLLED